MEKHLPIPCKVVVCGDSISAGVIFNEKENRYVKLKSGFVNLLQSSLNCAVTNISRFGNTIATAMPKLVRSIDREKPDIVLIELGGNDCDFNWEQVSLDPAGTHFPATDLNAFKGSLKNTISALREKGISPVLMTLPPIDADRYFKWISKSSTEKASKILEWLGSVTRIYWWQEMYNAAVLKVAEGTNTVWIDVRSAFLSTPDFRKLLCKDGIHPNSDGHKIISGAIFDFLKEFYPNLLKTAVAI